MNLHLPLPKIRTIGDELTLSLAKNSHFSFLPSHFPSLPSRRGQEVTMHCGAEIRNEFMITLSIAKNFFALFVPPLSNGTSRATSDRKPKTNDQREEWTNLNTQKPNVMKNPGKVRARTYGTKSPSRSEALRFIDSAWAFKFVYSSHVLLCRTQANSSQDK